MTLMILLILSEDSLIAVMAAFSRVMVRSPWSAAARAWVASSLAWRALSALVRVMAATSSRALEVSSRLEACSLAPAARDWLAEATWPAASLT